MRKSSFDAKQAERLLREVFLTKEIFDALKVSEEEIKEVVTEENILRIQQHRMENLERVKMFKAEIENLFPRYRFSARLKSLPSIFGKMLCHRTLADIYGIKVVVPNIDECYFWERWLKAQGFEIVDYEDKILRPKANGYRDLKIVANCNIDGEVVKIEFIIQTPEMYVDSHTIQKHSKVYPWKYHDVIKNLPAEYEYVEF